MTEPAHIVGLTLHRGPDHTSLITTPGGEVLQIELPPDELAEIVGACDGTTTVPEILARCADPSVAADVLDSLLEQGCLSEATTAPGSWHWARWPEAPASPERPAGARVLLDGDEILVAALGEAMVRGGIRRVRPGLPGQVGDADLVVTATIAGDADRVAVTAAAAAAAGVAWAGFHLDRGVGVLGPLVVPGRTADHADLIDRRRCASTDPELWSALATAPYWGTAYVPPGPELAWMADVLVIELSRWLAGAPCRLLSAELEANPVSLELTVHPVLPHPAFFGPELLTGWAPTPNALVSPRTGIVVGLRDTIHHPSVPAALRTVTADVADMANAARRPWRNDVLCGGTSFTSHDDAVAAALGEAAERYSANWTDTLTSVRASYDELTRRGEAALDPERLVLYSESQYDTAGFPFRRFTRDLSAHWVPGRSLTTGEDTWLPASQVYINWRTDAPGGEPALHFHNYVGVQAGPTLEFALTSAIEEAVERDATMTWWANRHPLPALTLPDHLAAHWSGGPTAAGQRAWAIHLDNEFGVPVMAGVVEHGPDRLLTVGFAARADPGEALLKAWGEALILQEGSRDLDLPDDGCAIRSVLASHNRGGDYLKPWRPDRSYLDAYRPDFRDVVQLLCQQQLNLDPRARAHVAPWLDVPATRAFDTVAALPTRDLGTYQKIVESRGYEILYADLTTPDVAACGLRVVRVIIPGLVPNFPAAFPAWGRSRVQAHAAMLGWPDLPETELNTFPLPYA
ncbi:MULTISPECIES: YcaO-like family protein [Parafrankia]|uniref:YcaO-like family protein n=1 Tax=Parafrankia TaxID=2994362 RepID=UPI0034D7920D